MRSAITLCLLLAFASCNEDDGSPVGADGATVIMPLKVGNTWVFRTTWLDSTGSALSAGSDTIQILGDTTILSETWYSDGEALLTNRPDGLYLWERPTLPQYLLAKYPAALNDAYVTSDGNLATVVSTNVSVTVPLSSYTCYQYGLTENGNPWRTFYFSPGKGLVKYEFYSMNPSGLPFIYVRAELQALSLN